MKTNTISVYMKDHWKKLVLELLVVFLGVTAGFILNNYRMNLQDKKLENDYYSGFLREININCIELQKAIKRDSLWVQRLNPLLELSKYEVLCIDSANSIIRNAFSFSKANMSTVTYKNIINSGKFNLITNFQLKERIIDYHSSIDDLVVVHEGIFSFYLDSYIPYVLEEYCFTDGLYNPEKITIRKLTNYVLAYHSVVRERMIKYRNLLSKGDELKNDLIKEHN